MMYAVSALTASCDQHEILFIPKICDCAPPKHLATKSQADHTSVAKIWLYGSVLPISKCVIWMQDKTTVCAYEAKSEICRTQGSSLTRLWQRDVLRCSTVGVVSRPILKEDRLGCLFLPIAVEICILYLQYMY